MAAEGGVLTFDTALNNEQLAADLEDVKQKIESLKKSLAKTESQKSAIEEQMESADRAADGLKARIRELRADIERLEQTDPLDIDAWRSAQSGVRAARAEIEECEAALEKHAKAQDKLATKWEELDQKAQGYRSTLDQANASADSIWRELSSQSTSAGVDVSRAAEAAGQAIDHLGNRISGLVTRVFIFSVITKALNELKSSIGDALMQNDLFSSTWTALSATMQGFANGVADYVAPAITAVVNAVMVSITGLARAIDTVLGTGLVKAIASSQKAAEATWRQTDASKAAAKEAEKQAKAQERSAKQREKAEERYAKQLESTNKRRTKAEESAAKRQSKAEESAAKRQSKAEERAAERQQDAVERREKAERKAGERYEDAVESANKRRTKAEQRNAERNAEAQATYEKKVARATEQASKRTERAQKRREQAAKRLQKAQEKANQSLLGFDEINKLNEDSTDDLEEEIEDASDALEDFELKQYDIDPDDYLVDPDDYKIDPEDYLIDPDDYKIDPNDYLVDPEDYAIDLSDYEVEPPDLSAFETAVEDVVDGLKPDWDAFDVGRIEQKLMEIMGYIGVALMAVGAILVFSGVNIPLGLGMIVAGAMLAYPMLVENWDALGPQVQKSITECLVIAGLVLMVLGVILILTYVNLPLGVGMLAAGALMEYGAAALNWGALGPEMQAAVTVIVGIVAGALFAFGVLLCLTGNIPLGIGLIIVGAVGIAADVALNWDSLGATMGEKIATIMKIVGGFLIGIGVVLLLTSANLALGIGFIIAGASAVAVSEAIVNWDTLGPLLEQHVNDILTVAMIGLFAIGVLLCLIGNMPLGIGCIAAATIAGVTLAAINWDTLGPLLEQHVNEILGVAMIGLFAIGVVLCLLNMLPLGIGCIVAATIAGVTLAAINWNTLGPLLEQHVNEILAIAMIGLFAIGVILCLLNMLPLGIGCIAAATIAGVTLAAINWGTIGPLLEQHVNEILATAMIGLFAIGVILCLLNMLPLGIGCIAAATIAGVTLAVINWDTIGPMLEQHLGEISTIAMGALFVIGVILILTGAAAPLGIGCIVAAGIIGVTEIALNWDWITEQVSQAWDALVKWWDENVAPIFTVEWWTTLFGCIGEAIVGAINGATETFNKWMQGIQDSLAGVVGATGGTYENHTPAVPSVRPPGLATGAVIPPNRRFMAVLGDQTHGNNLEAPEGLMRQVVREEAGAIVAEALLAMQAGQQGQEGGDLVVPLIIDSVELARAVFRGQGKASRMGVMDLSAEFV